MSHVCTVSGCSRSQFKLCTAWASCGQIVCKPEFFANPSPAGFCLYSGESSVLENCVCVLVTSSLNSAPITRDLDAGQLIKLSLSFICTTPSNTKMSLETASLPSRFVDIKREIAASHADFEQRLTNAWVDVLKQLDERTNCIIRRGPSVSNFLLG